MHPSPVRGGPAPDDAQVRMLAAFCDAGRSLTRREAEERAFGVTSYTAVWAASAVRELVEAGYLERMPLTNNRYRATSFGRNMLAFVRVSREAAS